MDIFELDKKFKNCGADTIKRYKIIEDEYELLLPEMNKSKLDKFVSTNGYRALLNFARFYELDEKGPMERFITTFYKVNGNLDLFSESCTPLDTLNSALAKDFITENQLKDVCAEGDRTLIIYNESFWKVFIEQGTCPKENDLKWIILSEIDYKDRLNGDNICENQRINNALTRIFKDIIGTPDNSDEQIYKCHVTWCYIFFFTTLIHSLFNKEISEDEFVNRVKEGLTDFSLVKSKGFVDLDAIERAQKDCREEETVERMKLGF